jgi:hypothetical protein
MNNIFDKLYNKLITEATLYQEPRTNNVSDHEAEKSKSNINEPINKIQTIETDQNLNNSSEEKPEFTQESDEENNEPESNKIKALNIDDSKDKEIVMNFSVDLIAEFTRTVNEFTSVCSKMVKMKNIDKDTASEFSSSYDKIKNLIDAAKKS